MKILVAVSTCWDFEKNGSNTTMRQCWLKDCAAVGIDYRMFVGYGQGAESTHLTCRSLPMDTVFLPEVDDGYGDLSRKTQHSLRWAHARDYDFVFRCFPDTYCRPERLLASGFEASDYRGDFRGEHCNRDNYPSGGPGYFLSRKAYKILLDAPINESIHRVAVYAEDLWVGQIFARHPEVDLKYFDDNRFINRGTGVDGPLRTNEIISTHLSCPDRYHPGRMYEKHGAWITS